MKVLFVTWDGPQVSYLEGLFLPIFRRLADHGWEFHVLQFTWGDEQSLQQGRKACTEAGVPYRSVRVWRRPVSLGSLVTALKGVQDIKRAVCEWDIDIVMPRSTLPVLSCMRALRGSHLPMVFDADGLPLDERVDFGGMSSTGRAYRLLRDTEAQGVRQAEVVLTRTARAAEILIARAGAGTSNNKFFQVTNGRDSDQFIKSSNLERDKVRTAMGVDLEAPLLVYAGSIGGQYCLPEMLAFYIKVLSQRPDAVFLLLTGSPEIAQVETDKYPELKDKLIVKSVVSGDVPAFLASADLGLGFRKKSFSMHGVAPIKLGEYLLCGLPVIATKGIGDTTGISRDIGYLLDEHDGVTLCDAARWFVEQVMSDREGFRSRSRELGMLHYSLEASVKSYKRALEYLVKTPRNEKRIQSPRLPAKGI